MESQDHMGRNLAASNIDYMIKALEKAKRNPEQYSSLILLGTKKDGSRHDVLATAGGILDIMSDTPNGPNALAQRLIP